jgi:hypothetical protein
MLVFETYYYCNIDKIYKQGNSISVNENHIITIAPYQHVGDIRKEEKLFGKDLYLLNTTIDGHGHSLKICGYTAKLVFDGHYNR